MTEYPLSEDDYTDHGCDSVCPKCGHSYQVYMSDLPHWANDGYEWEDVCDECGTRYKVTLCVSASFRSEWKPKPKEAKP